MHAMDLLADLLADLPDPRFGQAFKAGVDALRAGRQHTGPGQAALAAPDVLDLADGAEFPRFVREIEALAAKGLTPAIASVPPDYLEVLVAMALATKPSLWEAWPSVRFAMTLAKTWRLSSQLTPGRPQTRVLEAALLASGGTTLDQDAREGLKQAVDALLPSWRRMAGGIKAGDRDPLDLGDPMRFAAFSEELVHNSRQYGGPCLTRTPASEVCILIAIALISEVELWTPRWKDAFERAYQEILRHVFDVQLPNPETHALEVALLWAHGVLPRDGFSWSSKGWDGCPQMARFVLLNYLHTTVHAVLSWLAKSHSPGGPRIPQLAHNPAGMAAGFATLIRDYLVLWPAGICPCCRGGADGNQNDNNQRRATRHCLRRHRLPGFLKHFDPDLRSRCTLDDLKSPKGLLGRLLDISDPAHAFFSGLFSPEAQALLLGAGRKRSVSAEIQSALAEELDRIILHYDLEKTAAFAGLLGGPQPSAGSSTVLSTIRRNRLLLEKAFDKEITKSPILSLGRFLQEAVRNSYGPVHAGALESGMLLPLLREFLLRKGCQLDFVPVAVRHCACPFLFSAEDITDLPSLVGKLKASVPGSLSERVFRLLPKATRGLILDSRPGIPSGLHEVLPSDLNGVIGKELLHQEPSFENVVSNSAQATQWAAENPDGAKLARLNRLLLELAYPTELKKAEGTLVCSYMLQTCHRCSRPFAVSETIVTRNFYIDTSANGGFLRQPSWTCAKCARVFPARLCRSRDQHEEAQPNHDACPKCKTIHPRGVHWNLTNVYWWVAT